ncbi:class I SAM-dependent methyltransferase [Rheinheimera sp.]|uniref:class I SAM-dependent methyltransferase n=1 Tax=Rheinheimera sp. TaxID=1869214 RepID=UPI00307CD226
MLDNSSQMVLRNSADLKGTVLVIEPPADRLVTELAALGIQARCFTTNAAVAHNWQSLSADAVYLGKLPDQHFDSLLIFHPKSKEQLPALLQQLKAVAKADSLCFLVGDNKGGIKSLPALADKIGVKVYKLDNAKHCLWFELDHLSELQPVPTGFLQFQLKSGNTEFVVCSQPGVFNHGKLDLGTRLLLEHLGHVQKGKVLDFGCGAGIVGAYLKKNHSAIELVASDISTLAVESTEATLAANQLSGTVLCADGFPGKTGLFDHIVSNPPFHTGLKTDYQISEQFFQNARQQLKPGGSLTLVANVHLPYAEQLKSLFNQVKELGRRDGFVVYYCQ